MTPSPEQGSGLGFGALSGCEVLVTRPAGQNRALIDAINACGGVGHALPTLVIEPVLPSAGMPSVEAILTGADIALFTSVNAVCHVRTVRTLSRTLAGTLIGAVGAKTARELHDLGLSVHLAPGAGTRFDSEGLLALDGLAAQRVGGLKVVIVKGVGGRRELTRQLGARGARVHELDVYRRIRPAEVNPRVVQRIRQGAVGAVLVTSVEGLTNLFVMLEPQDSRRLRKLLFVTVSERIASAARERGIAAVVVAEQASDNALLASLASAWAAHVP